MLILQKDTEIEQNYWLNIESAYMFNCNLLYFESWVYFYIIMKINMLWCSKLSSFPPIFHVQPEPENVSSFWNTVFADIIKLRWHHNELG